MKFIGWLCYEAARLVMGMLAVAWWRVRWEGRDNIPKTGAFILAPVHRSNIDGPLTCIFAPRHMRYLAKEGLFRYESLGKLFTSMGAIRVERGVPDRRSMHIALEALQSGEPLVLFPEGTRRDGPVVEYVHEGAAYLALRAGVPIVPVGIGGSEKVQSSGSFWLRPVKLAVIVGDPIVLPKPDGEKRLARSAIHEGSELLKSRLQTLFDQAQRYAGVSA